MVCEPWIDQGMHTMHTHVPHECLLSLVFSCHLATGGKPNREKDKSTVSVLVFRTNLGKPWQRMVEQAFSPGISGTHQVFVLADHRRIYSGDIGINEKDRGWRVEEWRGEERRGRRGGGRRGGGRRGGGRRGGGRRGGGGGGRRGGKGQETKERRESGKERRKEEGENEVSKGSGFK